MTPDVIVCWPRNCDYPLWRQFIRDNRARFAKVIVVFTEHPGRDLSDWVRANFPEADSLVPPPVPADGDWRDVAVNFALIYSDAEWVWFTEQDFLIREPELFWANVNERAETFVGPIGWQEPVSGRWHPSCLFVRRDVIEQTSRYFGSIPVDHFYTFGLEIHAEHMVMPLDPGSWEHLQGLSQNHSLIDAGESAGVFRRDRFRQYLRDCLASDVPLEPEWAEAAKHELRGARGAGLTAAIS